MVPLDAYILLFGLLIEIESMVVGHIKFEAHYVIGDTSGYGAQHLQSTIPVHTADYCLLSGPWLRYMDIRRH